MVLDSKEKWYLNVAEHLDEFCKRVDEKIDKEQQQMKECKKKTELEIKLAQEIKLNNELTERLAELNRRETEIDRVCASFESCLTIAESDQNRLDNAKESYQLAKELTGIRLDFSAPPNIAKGYIKSEARKLLQPFEIDMNTSDSAALWGIIQGTAASGWPFPPDKENKPNN